MAYGEFSYYYDELNGSADYDALFQFIGVELQQNGIVDGIIVDLGCGTGELTLMLAQIGYDMIAVDSSEEMLSVVQDKLNQIEINNPVLLLNQDICELELYGTIRAAISTFDTYSHISPDKIQTAIEKASFYMEKGGIFIFDLNTPYKNEKILGNNSFEIETPDVICKWTNHYDSDTQAVEICLNIINEDTNESITEHFFEYSYHDDQISKWLNDYGFLILKRLDGTDFSILQEDSQRIIYVCQKQFTQKGDSGRWQ